MKIMLKINIHLLALFVQLMYQVKKENFLLYPKYIAFSTLYWEIGFLLLFIHYISCLYQNMEI